MYICSGGSSSSPSVCKSSIDQLNFLNQSAGTMIETIGTITTILQIISSYKSVMSLGPTIFIGANANSLIRTMTFIPSISNNYSEYFLRSSSKFFDYDFLPYYSLTSSFTFSFNFIEKYQSTDTEQQIGIKTQSTLYTILIKFC